MHIGGKGIAVALAALVIGPLAATSAAAAPGGRPAEDPADHLATPQLIDRAVRQGPTDRATGDLFLAYALAGSDKLPPAYRSDVPWDGTLPLLHLRERLAEMPPGPGRAAIKTVLQESIISTCSSDSGGPNTFTSTYFHIEYGTIGGGLTIGQYATSLDTAWDTEVNDWGWAAPPVSSPPPPGSMYPVIVANLGSGLYGYVSSAGTYAENVGNNPNTTWVEPDAYATCMVLNSNYDPFPGTSQQALDSTTAHEFHHSIQFGYGALTGSNAPDDSFVEGGATWAEDEVFDNANDNYNYLWPNFSDDMGSYGSSPYPYWIVFRGLMERYGTGVAGGSEDVFQRFWESTSQSGTSNMLPALSDALVVEGTTLADAYHEAGIALKFNKACMGGYVSPYCLEEGPNYVALKGPTTVHGTISSVGGSFSGSIPDNYALDWVAIPAGGGAYNVTLNNTSAGGQLRASVVCDTGSGLVIAQLPAVVGAGGSTTLTGFSSTGCTSAIATITNQAQTAANPSSSTSRTYTLNTAGGGGTTPTISVNDVSVTEGGSGTTTTASFTATLSAPSTSTVTVNFATADGGGPKAPGATAPSDYLAASGTLTFVPGDTTEPINVTVNGDAADEPNEPFNVVLSSPTNATIGDGTAVGTIVDDDPAGGGCTKGCPPTGTSLSVSDATVTEPDVGTVIATFTVTLSSASTGTVTVNYATADGVKFAATAPSDYAAASGTLTFAPGDTSEPISVTVNGDALAEPNENFLVNLSGAAGASIADGSGVGTILNDD